MLDAIWSFLNTPVPLWLLLFVLAVYYLFAYMVGRDMGR